MAHKEWHSRGYLPHFDHPELLQFITLHLADSLPKHIVAGLRLEQRKDAEQYQRLQACLDGGYGACCLRDPSAAVVVEDALLHFDGERYRLLAWVVMPNHAHVVIETFSGHPLDRVVHSWKSFTSKVIGKKLGATGRLWYPDYYDRYVRDEAHYQAVVHYIHENPVKARLVPRAELWPFSSAGRLATSEAGSGSA